MDLHSNITAILVGYRIRKQEIYRDEIVITIAVKAKGYFPFGESLIPKEFLGIPTDIVESHCVPLGLLTQWKLGLSQHPLIPGMFDKVYNDGSGFTCYRSKFWCSS